MAAGKCQLLAELDIVVVAAVAETVGKGQCRPAEPDIVDIVVTVEELEVPPVDFAVALAVLIEGAELVPFLDIRELIVERLELLAALKYPGTKPYQTWQEH